MVLFYHQRKKNIWLIGNASVWNYWLLVKILIICLSFKIFYNINIWTLWNGSRNDWIARRKNLNRVPVFKLLTVWIITFLHVAHKQTQFHLPNLPEKWTLIISQERKMTSFIPYNLHSLQPWHKTQCVGSIYMSSREIVNFLKLLNNKELLCFIVGVHLQWMWINFEMSELICWYHLTILSLFIVCYFHVIISFWALKIQCKHMRFTFQYLESKLLTYIKKWSTGF